MRYMDIEYGIFRIWRRIQLYRLLITICIFITILSVFCGLAAAYFLFQGAFDLSARIQEIQSFNQLTPELWNELQSLAAREQTLTYGLIGASLLTIAVGFIFPALMLRKLIKSLRNLEMQLRESIRSAVHDFTHSLEQYGDEPFQNANYWVEAVMIAIQFFARSSHNPSLLLVSDLLELTREEMAYAKAKNAASTQSPIENP